MSHNPRPSAQWFYKKASQSYENRFRRKVPQWVHALGNDSARRLIGVSTRLGWKIPPLFVISGECLYGDGSLWSEKRLRIDDETEFLIKNKPLNLMNLPFDPAQAAMRACEKRQTGK